MSGAQGQNGERLEKMKVENFCVWFLCRSERGEQSLLIISRFFFLSRKRHILVVLVSSCCSLLLPPDSGIFTETVSMILTNLQPLHFTFNQDYKYLQMFITLLLYKTEQWQTELELMKS